MAKVRELIKQEMARSGAAAAKDCDRHAHQSLRVSARRVRHQHGHAVIDALLHAMLTERWRVSGISR